MKTGLNVIVGKAAAFTKEWSSLPGRAERSKAFRDLMTMKADSGVCLAVSCMRRAMPSGEKPQALDLFCEEHGAVLLQLNPGTGDRGPLWRFALEYVEAGLLQSGDKA